jgi:hypothetical protein
MRKLLREQLKQHANDWLENHLVFNTASIISEDEFDTIWQTLGGARIPIKGDGNCMFRSIAVQLPPDVSHEVLREAAANYLVR